MNNTTLIPLYGTRFGQTYKCKCCNVVQIEYKNYSLCLQPRQFRVIKHTVCDLLNLDASLPDDTKYWLKFSSGKIGCLFTKAELMVLFELLDGTEAMLELLQILNDAEEKQTIQGHAYPFAIERMTKITRYEYAPLYTTAEGTASASQTTGEIALTFSNLILLQSKHLLFEFREFIHRFMCAEAENAPLTKAQYRIKFAPGEVAMHFPKAQLIKLYELVNGAAEKINPLLKHNYRYN